MAGSSVPPARCTKNRKQRGKKQILVRSKIHSPKSGLATSNAPNPTPRTQRYDDARCRRLCQSGGDERYITCSPSYRSCIGVSVDDLHALPGTIIHKPDESRKRTRLQTEANISNGF